MRIIALDYGTKRIGVAVSDDELLTAHGLKTLGNDGGLMESLRVIVAEYRPERLVIGYPRRARGEPGTLAKEIEAFRARLGRELAVAAEFWDEGLTTFAAEEALKEAGRDGRRRRRVTDAVAAAVMLQDYLESKRAALLKNG